MNNFFINKLNKYLPKDNEKTKGFFLFNPPTGSGKTTATIKYIADSINNKSKRKIFFITNLKENLDKPYSDLKEQVKSKRILRLLSVEEELCRLCNEKLWQEPKIYNFVHYNSFKEFVEIYNRQKEKENYNSEYLSYLKSKYEEQEQKFKAEIYKKIDELKKSKDKSTKNQLKKELKRIYRTIDLTKDYDVVFLTTQKFLYKIYDPFLGSDYIYNMKEFKDNSICFIDEFDSQKNIFLQIEIDKFVEETKDYISIFLKIYAGLEHKHFSKKFEFQEELEKLKEYFSKIYYKNHLQYSHKLEDDPSKTNILFKDIEYFSVDKRYYTLQIDKENESNVIIRSKSDEFEKIKDKNLGLLNTLNDVIVSINSFIANINQVSQKYYNENIEKLEFSNAISTILNEVNIPSDDKIHNFLKSRILERNRIRWDNYYSDWSKNAFYDKGFRYFSFHNSINFNTKTNIDFKVFDNTPEKILTQIAEHSFIVGISATALNQSVTSNFKLEYLKNRFPNNYTYLNKDELKELEKLYIDAKKDKKDNYQVEVINYSIDETDEYSFKREAEKLFDEDFEWWIEEHQNRYHINRYFKIVKAYIAFKQNSNIQSFLCLLTTYPKDEVDIYEGGLNRKHLNDLIKSALKKSNIDFNEEEDLYFIYDSDKKTAQKYEKEIKAKLKNGEKVFVISTYQGLGIGKNIQYKVLDKNKKEIEKDFDAIYLDKPTFLLERLSGDKQEIGNEKSLIKYIYQLETLYTDGQISRRDLEQSIKSAFNTTFNQKLFRDSFKHSITEDYIHSASKVIIQAIGRLHRTSVSSKKYIFIDKNLAFLNTYRDTNSFNLLSFETILQYIKKIDNKNRKRELTVTQIVDEKNFKVRSKIEDSLQIINSSYKSSKNEKRIKEWQDIREFVLKNPTIKEITPKLEDRYEQFYFKYHNNFENRQLKYFYKEEHDYRHILNISWEREANYIEVSSRGAKLDLIRNNSYLKEKFEEHGYALHFNTTGLYMMIPIVYNNIYKGALGEKVGKFLIEQDGTLKLLDLDKDEFEKFDYKISNGVYIDFKYFGESTGKNIDIEKLITKSEKKLDEINGKKVIIINCFGDDAKYIKRPIKRKNISIYPFIINMKSEIDTTMIEEIRKDIRDAN